MSAAAAAPARSSGESLLGAGTDGSLIFSHFDGRTLRKLQVEVDSWSLHEEAQEF
jgi:hypothetical protein